MRVNRTTKIPTPLPLPIAIPWYLPCLQRQTVYFEYYYMPIVYLVLLTTGKIKSLPESEQRLNPPSAVFQPMPMNIFLHFAQTSSPRNWQKFPEGKASMLMSSISYAKRTLFFADQHLLVIPIIYITKKDDLDVLAHYNLMFWETA